MSTVEVKSLETSKGLSKIVNDLGKRFQSRASPTELVQKNILREEETNSSAPKKEVEEEKKKDTLTRKLSLRPTRSDLKQKNILKENGSLENINEQNSMEDRAYQLRSCLKKRPNKTELEMQNILKGGNGASASIISAQEALKRSQLEDTLENKIRERPAVEELEDKKILLFAETVEVLPTFRKSEYNRKPDAGATFKNLTQQMKVEIREELNTFKKEEMDIHPESMLDQLANM